MNIEVDDVKGSELKGSEVEHLSSGFHERLHALLSKFKSVRAFASAAGLSQTGMQRLLNGGEPTLSTVIRIAAAAQVSVEWLGTGGESTLVQSEGAKPKSFCCDTLGNPVDLTEFVFIPRFNLQASAGYGSMPDGEKPLFTMAFRKYWIDNYLRIDPNNLSVISVKGDSMEGVLNDRDVILINHADNTPGAGLYVLRVDGELIVKRVQRIPGGKLRVVSANEAYEPFEVDLSSQPDDFAVIGKVVWFGRMV